MATKKGSGFEAPVIGTTYPKGTNVKVDKNGIVTIVPPKKSSGKKK